MLNKTLEVTRMIARNRLCFFRGPVIDTLGVPDAGFTAFHKWNGNTGFGQVAVRNWQPICPHHWADELEVPMTVRPGRSRTTNIDLDFAATFLVNIGERPKSCVPVI